MEKLVSIATGLALLAGCAESGGAMRKEGGAMNKVDVNKSVVKRFYLECINKRQFDLLPEYVTLDVVNHSSGSRGIDAVGAAAEDLHRAFENLEFDVVEVIGEGDRVAIRYVLRGTQVAPFAGQPPTGKPVERPGINWFRLSEGRISEVWLGVDPRVVRPPAPKAN